MSLPKFTLISQARGPQGQSLYLNADNFGNVTVQNAADSTSEWYPFAGQDGAVMFINVASGMALAVAGDNHTLTMTGASPRTNRNTWTFGGAAVRPAFNDDLNLNIRGNSYPAGTQVIVYKWDNDPNSKWNLTAVLAAGA